MRGSGSDDYVWIYDDGHEAEIFANLHSPPDWSHQTKISLSIPGPRTGIHLAGKSSFTISIHSCYFLYPRSIR